MNKDFISSLNFLQKRQGAQFQLQELLDLAEAVYKCVADAQEGSRIS